MILQIIVGLVLGLIYTKLDYNLDVDKWFKTLLLLSVLLVLYITGLFGIYFMFAYVFGYAVYNNVMTDWGW
jgi:hypothetical protein